MMGGGNKKNARVLPKLRFGEFEAAPDFAKASSGNWEEKSLGAVGEIVTGTTPPTVNKEYYEGKFPWITPTDIQKEKNIFSSMKSLTEAGLSRGRRLPRNSLLVTCIASIGKNAILRKEGSCNQQINAIIPNKENDVDFLYYLIERKKRVLIRFSGAGGMQILNKRDFSKLKFFIPSLPEQKKIAEFLGSVDAWIENLKSQKASLEQYKKGVMQRIFSPCNIHKTHTESHQLCHSRDPESSRDTRESRTEKSLSHKNIISEYPGVPEYSHKNESLEDDKWGCNCLRFRDENGKPFPEWEEKSLGEITDFYRGRNISRSDISKKGKQDCIRYGELYTEYGEIIKEIKSKTDLGKKDNFQGKNNDILIPSSGETAIDIARASCLLKENVLLGGDINVLRFKQEQSGAFFAYYFTHALNRNIAKMAQGNSVVHLHASHLKTLKILLPSLPEQQKIADFLTSLDDTISAKSEEITHAEQWKKGLMQKMFV